MLEPEETVPFTVGNGERLAGLIIVTLADCWLTNPEDPQAENIDEVPEIENISVPSVADPFLLGLEVEPADRTLEILTEGRAVLEATVAGVGVLAPGRMRLTFTDSVVPIGRDVFVGAARELILTEPALSLVAYGEIRPLPPLEFEAATALLMVAAILPDAALRVRVLFHVLIMVSETVSPAVKMTV